MAMMIVTSTSIPNQRGCATTASNVAFGDVTTPTKRDSRLMGACVAPASVEGVVIGFGSGNQAALEPPVGTSILSRYCRENTTEVRSRFRQFSERNLNTLCGLGTGAGTGTAHGGRARVVETRSGARHDRPPGPYAKLTRMGRSFSRAVLALIIAARRGRSGVRSELRGAGHQGGGHGRRVRGVADDATAVYWNPAGLALGGSYFSLVLDNNQGKAEPEDSSRGRTPVGEHHRLHRAAGRLVVLQAQRDDRDAHDRSSGRSARLA